jgi:hypothetical protein
MDNGNDANGNGSDDSDNGDELNDIHQEQVSAPNLDSMQAHGGDDQQQDEESEDAELAQDNQPADLEAEGRNPERADESDHQESQSGTVYLHLRSQTGESGPDEIYGYLAAILLLIRWVLCL